MTNNYPSFDYRRDLPWLAAIIIFVIALHGVFYGSAISFWVSGAVIAIILFLLRERNRLVYGLLEVVAGLFILWRASSIGHGAFSAGFSPEFQSYQWQIILVSALGAIYIIVRGLDNIKQGWQQRGAS